MEAGPGGLPVLAYYGLCGEHGLYFQPVYLVFGSVPLRQTATQVSQVSDTGKSQRDDFWSLAPVDDVDYSNFRMEVFHTRGP